MVSRLVAGPRRDGGSLIMVIRLSLLIAASSLLSGCILLPYNLRLQRVRLQLDSLEERVAHLEDPGSLALSAEPVPSAAVTALDLPTAPLDIPKVPFDGRKALTKLTRGLVNIVTGWVEIPGRVHETSQKVGAGAGFTLGLLRGVGYGFIRTAGGLYEVVTFPFPAPPDYRPLMRPDYVFVREYPEARLFK